MTTEATQLMDEALRVAKLDGSFCPFEIGERIGLKRAQALIAARALSDAGVLVLGFDDAAEFSPEFRKSRKVATPADAKPAKAKPAKAKKRAKAVTAQA